MCRIFGMVFSSPDAGSPQLALSLLENLILKSSLHGKEAAGLTLLISPKLFDIPYIASLYNLR